MGVKRVERFVGEICIKLLCQWLPGAMEEDCRNVGKGLTVKKVT
jgi:hypothetical protein